MVGGIPIEKKGCPVHLEWEAITPAVAVLVDKPMRPTHAVNPLNVQGEIVSYDPLPIPPHSIFRVAEILNDWFVFAGEHRVHVPRKLIREQAPPQDATASLHWRTQEAER
ncbi:MAG TPA: hypothetical protein VFS39_16880 [Nitrospira sp.]|nr:hypothetical protein [Nitrospira sp.]